jgi:hypothetical protein
VCAAAALVAIYVAAPSIETAPNTSRLPARLEAYLNAVVRPSTMERARLMEGAPLTRLLEADATKELAVFGAIWIDAPIRQYVDAVTDIEKFERGGRFKATRRISTPPRLEDFADLHLTAEDVDDLRTCRLDDCDLKLSQQGLQAFRTEVDWKVPNPQAAADTVMRRLAYEYVTGYFEKGNDRLAVYRDNSRPTFVAPALGVDSRSAAVSARVPGSDAADCLVTALLAGDNVRAEADYSYQPPRDPSRSGGHGDCLQDALREPLFLDGTRTAHAVPRPRTRTRLLADHDQSQPNRRLERLHRILHPAKGPQ